MQHIVPARSIGSGSRRGAIVPLVAIAILVVGGGIALVLDRLWLASAKSELLTIAEGASLAACRNLIDDESLKFPPHRRDEELRQNEQLAGARQAAAEVASRNTVAGHSVELDIAEGGDVRFGTLVRQAETNRIVFLETENRPTSVIASAYRKRSRNNPVALLFQELTGQIAGDVAARAEASWGNQIVGIRPHDNLPAPILPIAVLEVDPAGKQLESWMRQIEGFHGHDRFGYDDEKKAVVARPDGFPEIVLEWSSTPPARAVPNHGFIELGSVDERDKSIRQLKNGWNPDDLAATFGEIRLTPQTLDVWGRERLTHTECQTLAGMIGECRIICLCHPPKPSVQSHTRQQYTLTRFAAARIMAVNVVPQQNIEIVLQPAVVVTRAALLATPPGDEATSPAPPNPYIYKIQVTQ